MQSRDAKLLFRSGILDTAILIRHESGWIMKFATMKKWTPGTLENPDFVLQSRRSNEQGIRIFKTLDAACAAAKNIGFSKVSVYFDDSYQEEQKWAG